MKHFLLLIFCALSAAFVSCKEETDGAADFRFARPEVSDVTQTTANVSSRAAFTINDYPGLVKGFAYGPADEAVDGYRLVTVDAFERNAISTRLTGLAMGTRYRVHAFVELGASRIMSEGAEFETLAGSGDAPVLEIVSETTLSVPAEGGRQTIRYEVLNPAAGVDATASGDVAWITSFDCSEYGVVTFAVGANEGAARSGIVTLSYTGAEERTVVVNQASGGEPAPDEPTFGTPSHSGVAADRATVTCSFSYDGSESVSKAWFAYKASGGSEREASVSTAEGTKSTTLTGLSASTTYTYRLCVEIGGRSYSSTTASFTTSASGGGTGAGLTKHSGWPELVPEDEGNGDYYYAYHMCPDFKINGQAARNYTVCFSAEHHCPVWVAAPRHDCYEGSANRTDAYRQDPDIPSSIQYDSKDTGGGCNKGHMLGSAERTRSTAINRQVFYYSNIAPQYSSGFNTGGGGWNILEDWIDTQVCADTTYLVIGTYFEKYTDRYGNSASPKRISFGGRNDVSCPTMFYIAVLRTKSGRSGKSVLDCSADELMCAAFVRCHNNNLKGKQVSAKDMYTIEELEELTGHTFFSNVPNAPKDTYKASDWGL